jgi:DNA-binding response OmpR family regulator
MKILVVEDEKDMRESLVQSLRQEQYTVEEAMHYDAALEKIMVYEYDCILLDIGLPGGSGLELLAELKKEGKEGCVIIVSAKDSLEDKINGLNLGADDYLAKPFHMAELHARVRSVIRRKTLNGSQHITLSNLVIDPAKRWATVDGETMTFNRKEFDVLLYLAINKNRLVSKNALAEHVWGDRIDEANSFDFVYSQIKNLRKKLKDHNVLVEINAIYGVGYKLTA